MTTNLVAIEDTLDQQTRRVLAHLDRIEALSTKLAAERDEIQARLSAAALFLRHTIAAATDALDAYDHTQSARVHDSVVEALAHLRMLAAVLAGTPPEREVPSRRIRRH